MSKRDKQIVEIRLRDDWNTIKNSSIEQLTEKFQKHPNWFFTEHDIHSVLYDIVKTELQLNGVMTEETLDGHQVMLVHHEYPTPFRCDMHDHEFRRVGKEERTTKGGRYQRGHYDLVVLNPEFVRNNKLDVICGKDYQKFRSAMQEVKVEPLIWACEVIFFSGVKQLPKNAFKIVEQDALKVRETLRYKVGQNRHFCEISSVLVFTSHIAEDASDLKQQIMGLGKELKLEVTLITAASNKTNV